MVTMLFNKVLGENEKCVSYVYLKNQRNFLANSVSLHFVTECLLPHL